MNVTVPPGPVDDCEMGCIRITGTVAGATTSEATKEVTLPAALLTTTS
jgi:hypothetical protein